MQHVRPEQPERSRPSEQRDQALVALLRWYAARRSGGLPWRLVIGGDFVDFTGMSVTAAPGAVETEPTDEARQPTAGTGRYWDFSVERWLAVAIRAPIAWQLLDRSPHNPERGQRLSDR